MKRTVVFYIASVCMMCTVGLAESKTQINYTVGDLGAGRWQYTYEVANLNLSINSQPAAIREFTIWFNEGLYDNLAVTTTVSLSTSWDEIVWQPEPVLGDSGAYDALTLTSNLGIQNGQSLYGFSVSFDWLGEGTPGSQYYEIINPDTFETFDSGYTIPEPATIALLGLGGLILRKRK